MVGIVWYLIVLMLVTSGRSYVAMLQTLLGRLCVSCRCRCLTNAGLTGALGLTSACSSWRVGRVVLTMKSLVLKLWL